MDSDESLYSVGSLLFIYSTSLWPRRSYDTARTRNPKLYRTSSEERVLRQSASSAGPSPDTTGPRVEACWKQQQHQQQQVDDARKIEMDVYPGLSHYPFHFRTVKRSRRVEGLTDPPVRLHTCTHVHT